MNKLLFLLILTLPGCTTWEKPYALKSGRANLTAEITMQGRAFVASDAVLEIYEELPDCQRSYLGTVYLKQNNKNPVALPVGKELIIFFLERKQTIGRAESKNSSIRMQVKPDEEYHFSLAEGDGGPEVHFAVKSPDGKLQELAALPDRECPEIRIINL